MSEISSNQKKVIGLLDNISSRLSNLEKRVEAIKQMLEKKKEETSNEEVNPQPVLTNEVLLLLKSSQFQILPYNSKLALKLCGVYVLESRRTHYIFSYNFV